MPIPLAGHKCRNNSKHEQTGIANTSSGAVSDMTVIYGQTLFNSNSDNLGIRADDVAIQLISEIATLYCKASQDNDTSSRGATSCGKRMQANKNTIMKQHTTYHMRLGLAMVLAEARVRGQMGRQVLCSHCICVRPRSNSVRHLKSGESSQSRSGTEATREGISMDG